jgi:hypothetical protein
MSVPSADTDELARFGYKQELDRSLGLFSSFAAGFSYISIMTGVFELFFFGFASGGPAFIWTWPAVFAGQMLVALCFAELAGQYPRWPDRSTSGRSRSPGRSPARALLPAVGLPSHSIRAIRAGERAFAGRPLGLASGQDKRSPT